MKNLQELNLSSKYIGESELIILSKSFYNLLKLKKLDLGNNFSYGKETVTKYGISKLIESLKTIKNLGELCLDHNGFRR